MIYIFFSYQWHHFTNYYNSMKNSSVVMTREALNSVTAFKHLIDHEGDNIEVSSMKECIVKLKDQVKNIIETTLTKDDLTDFQRSELQRLRYELQKIM